MAGLICALLLSAAVLVVSQEDIEGGKCERIKLPLCQDLGYNWTAMPNLVGHHDQKEAEEAMAAFEGVLASGCSEHARFLLCSAFAPLCSEQVSGAVSACRAVCEAVATDCAEQLKLLPSTISLDCGAFPLRADRRLCMRPPNGSEPRAEPPPPPPAWGERGCPPGHTRVPSGECWPACGEDARHSHDDKRAAELWMTALAWLSLASTSLALAAFCAEPARYRYPERPVVWMAACHCFVAVAHAARGWLGARVVSCAGDALAQDGLSSPGCLAFFTITYYFTLAADAWFTNACVAWYLTAASEWSTEALERAAAYLHAAAWGWAGAWTAAALALRRVSADELTGTCGVSDAAAAALVGVPRGALLVTALALGVAAAPGVARVRRALGGRGAKRVGRLAARAAITGAIYLILASMSAIWRLVEARERLAESSLQILVALEAGELPGSTGGGSAVSSLLVLGCGAAAGACGWVRRGAAAWRRLRAPRPPAVRKPPPLLHPQYPPVISPYYKRPLHVSRV